MPMKEKDRRLFFGWLMMGRGKRRQGLIEANARMNSCRLEFYKMKRHKKAWVLKINIAGGMIVKEESNMRSKFEHMFENMTKEYPLSYAVIETKEISFSEEVRKYCEANTCNAYGKSWTCPPGVGTVEECKRRTLSFSHMLVFSSFFELEDSFDFEGMMRAMDEFKKICRQIDDIVHNYLDRYLILSNEGCNRCATCTYPDQPCRMPDKIHPSIEGFGIWVNELAKSAGLAYHHGKDTVTYFGGVLFDEKDLRYLVS